MNVKSMLGSGLLLVSACGAMAAEPTFVLESGEYKVGISPTFAYTVRSISFAGHELGTPSGFYGTVMAPEPGKYIGAGHKEGGTEQILEFRVAGDGQVLKPEPNRNYQAKEFVVSKISRFDNLIFQTNIKISAAGVVENKRFTAVGPQKLNLLYLALFCWAKETTGWCAELADGQRRSGLFAGKFSGKSFWHLQEDIKWAAVYDSSKQCGMIMAYPTVIPGQSRKSAFWEVRNAYNKYYLMAKVPPTLKQDYISPEYVITLKGFKAAPDAWHTAAATVATTALMLKPAPLPPVKVTAPQVAAVSAQGGTPLFVADYSVENDRIDANTAVAGKTGKVRLEKKASFEFDTMAHTQRGLMIGEKCASVQYDAPGNLPTAEGALEMLIKANNRPLIDDQIRVFFQTAGTADRTCVKMLLYQYKKSGLAVYLELPQEGKKLFLNDLTDWKADSWHHVLVSWKGANVTLYVDGIKRKDGVFTGFPKWPAQFFIGPQSDKFGRGTGTSTVGLFVAHPAAVDGRHCRVLAKNRLPELKLDVAAADAMAGHEIGTPSPWFKERPKLAMAALDDQTVVAPWTPMKWRDRRAGVLLREYDFSGTAIIDRISSCGMEILNAPVSMVMKSAAGTEIIKFGPPILSKQTPGRIVMTRAAASGINLEYLLEYDGMIWCRLRFDRVPAGLEALTLLVPFNRATARFIHYVGAPVRYESQDLPRNSFSRELDDKPGLVFESALKTSVWIGNNERGLLWFVESDQYWWPKDRKNVIEVFRETDGGATLKVNMIAAPLPPVALKSGFHLDFGLMGTPVRTQPEGWRDLTVTAQYDSFKGDNRGKLVIYWPNEWRYVQLDPEPSRAVNPKRTADKVRTDRNEGRKVVPYWTRLHYSISDGNRFIPDAEAMREEWGADPGRPGGGSHVMYRASCSTAWSDYLVWCADQWGEVFGPLDGVYMDETQPIPNLKEQSGGGYTDVTGQRRATFEMFGTRNMFKRLNYLVGKKSGRLPLSIAHASGTHWMQALGQNAFFLIGEHFYSGYFGENPEFIPPAHDRRYYYSYALPMDRLRAECYWRQWGTVMIWLPCLKNQKDIMTDPVATRDMLSRVMQADMLIWPLFCNPKEVHKTWKFRREFGIGDPAVKFVPYWENRVMKTGDANIVAGYYQNGEKYLVLVSNLNRQDRECTLELKGLNISGVKNAETGDDLLCVDGKIKLQLKRNDYLALRLNY